MRTPGEIRTPTLLVRSQAQLSVVLPGHVFFIGFGTRGKRRGVIAASTGFEPAPPTVTGWRSAVELRDHCSPGRRRTCILPVNSRGLRQLSYRGMTGMALSVARAGFEPAISGL